MVEKTTNINLEKLRCLCKDRFMVDPLGRCSHYSVLQKLDENKDFKITCSLFCVTDSETLAFA